MLLACCGNRLLSVHTGISVGYSDLGHCAAFDCLWGSCCFLYALSWVLSAPFMAAFMSTPIALWRGTTNADSMAVSSQCHSNTLELPFVYYSAFDLRPLLEHVLLLTAWKPSGKQIPSCLCFLFKLHNQSVYGELVAK